MAQEVLEEAHKEIPRLLHLIFQDKETQGHGDLEASELSIRHAMHQLGGVLMEKRINADQGDHRGARIAWGAGHEAECRADRPKHVTTVFSEMGINRAYDDCSSCHRGILPKDTDWDMEHTSFSPGVRRMMARGGANESFEDGRRDWDELAGVPGTAREVGGVAEAMGAQVQTVADRERVHVMAGTLLPLVPPVPILYIAMDGTGVPVVPSETAGRQGQRTAIAQTREANLGAVFTQTTVAAKGPPMREEASTTSVGCLETAEAFGPRLDAEAVKRGVHRAKKVLVLGDGAAWIRGMTQEHCSPATQMVDLCHALEYLWDVGKVVDGPTA